jgi:ABC-type polysaccharide/polyol phosphate export permease
MSVDTSPGARASGARETQRGHGGYRRPTTVYEPRSPISLHLRDLWTYRHFVLNLGWGYVRKRYAGTWLGWLWIPLAIGIDIMMRVLVFGGFLGVSPGNRPYLIFLMVGSAAWLYYERASFWGYRSLQFNRRHLGRVQVPWLAAIVGTVIPGALEAAMYAVIGACAAVYYKLTQGSFYLTIDLATIDVLAGFLLLTVYAWALGLILGPLVAVVRDLRHLLRYAFGFWYYLTPILYPVSSLPKQYQSIAIYNPLTAPMTLVQHGLLGLPSPRTISLVVSLAVLAVLLPLGLFMFRRFEYAAHARL